MHLHVGGMSRKKPLELFMNNSIFGGNPNEISPYVSWHVYDFSPLSHPTPTPFLATACWVQGLELVNLSSWRRTVYQIPILRPGFFYDCEPGKFYENHDLTLEVNSSEILRTKR